MTTVFTYPLLTVDEGGKSIFQQQTYPKAIEGAMILTEQISAINFRCRESLAGYQSEWHIAGDPTLIIVQQGCLRVYLRSGEYRDFSAGECFIAADYLPLGSVFDDSFHGHRAEVIGSDTLRALHIKLSRRED